MFFVTVKNHYYVYMHKKKELRNQNADRNEEWLAGTFMGINKQVLVVEKLVQFSSS